MSNKVLVNCRYGNKNILKIRKKLDKLDNTFLMLIKKEPN